MALRYPPQNYDHFQQQQWPGNVKTAFTEDDDSSVLDDKVLDSSISANMNMACGSRRPSMVKLEDDYAAASHVWQGNSHDGMDSMRQYSQPHVPMLNTNDSTFMRMNEHHYGSIYSQHHSQWPMSAHTDNNTSTPTYGSAQEGFGQPVQYPITFSGFSQHDPASAVSMSPQSSQGGWASGASSDSTERQADMRSPTYRIPSPTSVLRPDGIRKKNARFEIPKDRNLSNIDQMIMSTTDETEKKELKQQKRLLRNRQAA